MAGYWLVEYGGGPGGPRMFSHRYRTVDEAWAAADHMLAALADRPHRRPIHVDIVDMRTREMVQRILPRGCDTGGPFPAAGGTGPAGTGAGRLFPSLPENGPAGP